MARLNDLTERRADDLTDTDEFAVQPEGDDTTPPQRSRLAWLKEFLLPSWVRNPDEDIPPGKIHQDSAGVDQTARDRADLAERTATDALNTANEAIGDIGDLLPLVTAAANPAAATPDEADDPTEAGLRSWSSALIARVVRAVVPAWARDTDHPASGVPAYRGQDRAFLSGRADALEWQEINQVPDTPGEQSAVDEIAVLAVRGTGDRAYGWHRLKSVITGLIESVVPSWARAADPPAGGGSGGGGSSVLPGGPVGPGLTPQNATRWHAYETTVLLEPDLVYEFIMQRGADASNQAPTVSFYGRELLEDIPVSTESAGDGYTPGNEPNHIMLIHGRSTATGGLTLHVARLPRAPGATTDKLLIHFQSEAYRIRSLVRLPSGGSAVPDSSIGRRVSTLEHQAADLEVIEHDGWVDGADAEVAALHARTAATSSIDIATVGTYDFRVQQAVNADAQYNVYLRIPLNRKTSTARVLLERSGAVEATLFEHWIYLGQDSTHRYYAWTAGHAAENNDVFQVQITGKVETTEFGGELPDDSVAYAKILAETAAQRLGWRDKIEATHIAPGIVLPPLDESRDGDIIVITQDVAAGLSFVDIGKPAVELAAAKAADIIMAMPIGRDMRAWVRLGNILEGPDVLIDTPANPISPTNDNADKLLFRAGWLYENAPIHFADPDATYRDFATADLPAGHTWGGAVQINPGAATVPDNRVIYSIPAERWERKITTGGRAVWIGDDPPANWHGPYGNESEADAAVTAVGDVVYFGGKVQVVETYTPRAPDRREWRALVDPSIDDEIRDAGSGSAHAQIGDATLTLIQFGDGRGVWTKEGILALRTIEPSGAYDPARAGGYGEGAGVFYEGVNYTALPGGDDPPGAFDPTKWERDAEQPTPYDQFSILTRIRNPGGLPDGQWVLTTQSHPDDASVAVQWLDGSPAVTNKLDLYQKDETGHWVEAGDDLAEGLLLFRFTLVDEIARGLFRNAADSSDVIRDNLHFLLGKALNISNYTGLGIDVRITVQSQPVSPPTPRRLPHLPQPMLEGEVVRLTEDDVPHPTSEQVYRIGPQSSNFNPSYGDVFPDAPTVAEGGRVYVFGMALAGTFGGVLDQFGPDNRYQAFGAFVPGVLRANGLRAIYTRSDHPTRIYVRMARALVADGEVNTLKFRLGAIDPDNMINWAYTTADMVPVPAETTADVRTFYCEVMLHADRTSHNIHEQFAGLSPDPQGSLVFSMLKGDGGWLHFNAVTNAVSFAEGQRYSKGFYEGAGDGNPVRVYLSRHPINDRGETARTRNLQPAVDGGDLAGVANLVLPADYAVYRTLSLTLWRTSVDRVAPLEIATEFLASQTSDKSIYTDNAVIGWNPVTRTISTPNQRIIYAELHDGGAAEGGEDATARAAAAAAQGTADAAGAAAMAAAATADAATTPAEATDIANQRAVARYSDAEKARVAASQSAAQVTAIANARAAATPGPVIIVSNIASFDAAANRFEDSGGAEVVVPNGAIVTLAQAVYDAAVSDAEFTPNANAIFLTR